MLYLFSVRFYLLAVLEDQILEQLQVSALIGAAVLAYIRSRRGSHRQRFFLRVLAFGALFLILEELSWGQRFLRFASISGFDEGEIEADFHNQIGQRIWFLGSPNWPLAVLPVIYGILLPLWTLSRTIAINFERLGLVLPRLSLLP